MIYKIIIAIIIGVIIVTLKMQEGSEPTGTKSTESFITTSSGLRFEDVVVGAGETPKQGQKVVVHYTGTLTNGKKFDSSKDRGTPFKFTLGVGQVIKGWDEGLSTMKVGGKRNLVIPSQLAYGPRAVGDVIPANATLNFEVELLGVE